MKDLNQDEIESLHVGAVLESVAVSTISIEQLKAYATASSDYNPIHQDEEVAKKAGLPGIIAHGMLVAGMMSERARMWLKANLTPNQYRSWKVISYQNRFRGMTFLGDTVFVGGTITEAKGRLATIELQAKNQKGDLLTTGVLKIKISH